MTCKLCSGGPIKIQNSTGHAEDCPVIAISNAILEAGADIALAIEEASK